jgi:peptide deformylase
MKDSTIVQIDDTANNPLRQKASLVTAEEFGAKSLLATISSMKSTLAREHDGVALAAPQIGITKRIFVVAPFAYEDGTRHTPLVFINPIIIKTSKKVTTMQEGCLSVRWIYGKTKRHTSATVEAYDEYGKKFTYGASGLIAHIFQHEIDHLDGKLFIDHGFDLEEYTEEEVRASLEK